MAASNQTPAYRPDQRLAQNAGQQPSNAINPPAAPPDPNAPGSAKTPGMALFEQGETALKAHDATRAYECFRQAAGYMNELDPITAQRLQDHLQLLAAPSRPKPAQPQAGQASSMANEAVARQQVLARQVVAELAHKESNARALRDADPKGALAMLEEARKKVESSGLESSVRDQLLRRVDRAIGETKQIIEQNRPQIELDEKNSRTRQDVQRQQRMKVEVDEKLGMMIDEFNKLMDGRLRRGAGSQPSPRNWTPEPGRDAGPLAGEVRPPIHERQGHRKPAEDDRRGDGGRIVPRYRLTKNRCAPTPGLGQAIGEPAEALAFWRQRSSGKWKSIRVRTPVSVVHQRPAEQGGNLANWRKSTCTRSARNGRRSNQRYAVRS